VGVYHERAGYARLMFDLPPSPLLELVARVREPELPVVVIGHRGDSQNAPENTLAAFEAAIQAGAPSIELDLQRCASGELVVIHDEKVDRTTDGSGEVTKLSLGALRELSAGAWFSPDFADERIPTLDETLDLCRGRAVPILELKVKMKHGAEVGEQLAEALRRHGVADQVSVVVKEKARVDQLQSLVPETPLCYLTLTKGQAVAAARIPGVSGVDPYWRTLSLKLVRTLREQRCFMTPWTVNKAKDMDRLLELGVESVITDSPTTLADQIEGFEFARAEELAERFLRGEAVDVDLERRDDEEPSHPYESDSEHDLEVVWLEDPRDDPAS